MIEVRYSASPSHVETATNADLRKNFLVEDLFRTGEVHGVYTHDDRLVVGGAVPGAGQLDLPAWDVLGTTSHLARRELGIVNVGQAGHVLVNDEKIELRHLDGLFVGRGNEVTFAGFVTGNFDIIIQVVVRSQEALVEFLTVTLAKVDGVKSTETFVMPYEIKRATSWILPEEHPDQHDDPLDDIDYEDLVFDSRATRR